MPVVSTRFRNVTVEAELVSYKDVEAVLRDRRGITKTFRYAALGPDDKRFLDEYHKLEIALK